MNYGIDPDIIALYGAQAVKDSLASLPAISITTDLANLFDPAHRHLRQRRRTTAATGSGRPASS